MIADVLVTEDTRIGFDRSRVEIAKPWRPLTYPRKVAPPKLRRAQCVVGFFFFLELELCASPTRLGFCLVQLTVQPERIPVCTLQLQQMNELMKTTSL